MSTRTLTTTLPSDTLYVSGTVNGVSTTWTNTEGNTWQTVAARSAKDVYVVALLIINSLGTATETTFTLYYGLHLVTDRTKADVTAQNDKGTYNAEDLNRVGAAVQYLADIFHGLGYGFSVSAKTDWNNTRYPKSSDMERYLQDVSTLRGLLAQMEATPKVPKSMEKLTYLSANNIEQILEDIDDAITRMKTSLFYVSEIYCGEV